MCKISISLLLKVILVLFFVPSTGLGYLCSDGTEVTDSCYERSMSPYFYVKGDPSAADSLPLLSTSTEVNIGGVIADVRVTQIYKNNGSVPIEAVYVLPASAHAAVYKMAMTIDDRVIEAIIMEKEEAGRSYKAAKKEGRTASLLEEKRPNVFQMNVANILPDDIIKVELHYTELIVPTDGVYEFVYPTVVGPRYSNQGRTDTDAWVSNPYLKNGAAQPYAFDIITNISAGMDIKEITSPSHKVDITYLSPSKASISLKREDLTNSGTDRFNPMMPGHDKDSLTNHIKDHPHMNVKKRVASDDNQGGERDYILKYRLADGRIESGLMLYEGDENNGEENFFLMMIQPPKRIKPEDIPPREYIFVMDVSGSMHGYPINISKKLLKDMISCLRPVDKFNLLLFAGDSTLMSERSVQGNGGNIQTALSAIERQKGRGGTELLHALKQAMNIPMDEGISRSIVIITDGYVHVETEAFEYIRTHLNHSNVYAFGIGTAVNRFLIEGLARAGQGESFVITKQEEALAVSNTFREYISSPILTGIEVDFDDFITYDIEPSGIPDVLAERPILIFGKWRGAPEGNITITGVSGSENYRRTFTVHNGMAMDTHSGLPYLWARKRIEILADYNRLKPDGEIKKAITSIGLSYNLLTPYTSFIAEDKVKRNNAGQSITVRQPLPLPKHVSQFAVSGEPGLYLIFILGSIIYLCRLLYSRGLCRYRGMKVVI